MTQRFLLYSHDTYGLGHLRRNTNIAAALVDADPDTEVLLVSGSPRSASFRLPQRTDVVQLPSVTKTASGAYRPRNLTGELGRIVSLRSAIIDTIVSDYRPDVIIVDHAPAGMGGELRLALRRLATDPRRPRLVLGLREIIDEPEAVNRSWTVGGEWEAVDVYDDVVVYGDERVLSTATELNLSERIGKPIPHVGYCGPRRRSLDLRTIEQPPLVVVTVGGGGDGHKLCHRYLDFLQRKRPDSFRSVVVTGPLMSKRRRVELERRAQRLGDFTRIVAFEPAMRDLLNSAETVISMGGYNSVVELLGGGIPSLIVPRTHPRREQAIRAERLGPLSHLEMCHLDSLTDARLDEFLARSIGRRRHPVSIDLDGARGLAQLLSEATIRDGVTIHG